MLNLLSKPITGLSNYELEEIGKKCLINFKGVYPSDSFPTLKYKDSKYFSVIFNLSHHDEEGTHFIAVVKKNTHTYYFDSFGVPCTVPKLKESLKKITNQLIYSTKKLQRNKSFFCGLFCLAFILHMQKNVKTDMISFLKLFPCSIITNDAFIKNLIKKEITLIVCNKNEKK